jgi:NAD(P)-dependent dehydrogenase (short-subunit alcohol dehydrogenase family)
VSAQDPSAERVVLVTGANRGIGFEICRQLARGDQRRRRAYRVVLSARSERKAREAAQLIGPEVDALGRDVTDPESIRAAARQVSDRYGRLFALVNNAGVHYDTSQTAESADWAIVREAFDVNVFGAWRVAQAFVPLMRSAGRGRIVNVSSEAGSLASMGAGTPAYATSKAALNALTRVLAAELRGRGILVNAVCPGWTDTDMGGSGGRPIEEGAASVVWAVELADDGPSGGFFRDGKPLKW